MSVNKLSYSSVEKYLLCAKAWYLYYKCNLRECQVGSALFFGTSIDAGVNQLLSNKQNNTKIDAKIDYLKLIQKQKINEVETNLSKTSLIKYSNTDFDVNIISKEDTEMLQDTVSQDNLDNYHQDLIQLKREKRLTGEALKHFNLMSYTSLKQKGLMMIEEYEKSVLPTIEEVLDIQKFFSIKNTDGDEFLGFIDYIARLKDHKGIVIMDNKTSASAYKPTQAFESKQLMSYVGALRELNYTNEPISVGFNVMNKVIRKKKEPRVLIQTIVDKVNEDLIESVFEDYDRVNNAIHNGEFESSHPTCSKNNYGSQCLCQLPREQLVDISSLKEKK
jgi:hypothetical protein